MVDLSEDHFFSSAISKVQSSGMFYPGYESGVLISLFQKADDFMVDLVDSGSQSLKVVQSIRSLYPMRTK